MAPTTLPSRVAFAIALLLGSFPWAVHAGREDVLAEVLAHTLSGESLKGSRVGVLVRRLDDGVDLYDHGADSALVPASNVKLITSAAALHYLLPDFRFRTEVYGNLRPDGVVEGDLYVQGYGDPSLTPERVWFMCNRLVFLGVKEVTGAIVLDDAYFAGNREATGGEQDTSSYAYMAPAGALSVGFNAVMALIKPTRAGQDARVLIDPPSDYASVRGRVRTVSYGRTSVSVDVVQEGERDVVVVSGRIHESDAGRGYWRRITNPPLFAGEVIRAIAGQVGIVVRGGVRMDVVPPDQPKLYTLVSERLADLLSTVNKHSNNFMAEQVARALGAERYGAPGTWDKGKQAITSFLVREVGLQEGSFALGNGSGLHDVNRFTARQMVQVLDYMYRQPRWRTEYMASLATAGGTGTLSHRMLDTNAELLLRAKTGTLSVASALSGYVYARSGELLAFSVIVNDYRHGISPVWEVQDTLGATMATWDFREPVTESSATAVQIKSHGDLAAP